MKISHFAGRKFPTPEGHEGVRSRGSLLFSRWYQSGLCGLSVGDWGSIFGDPIITTAILDRLLHHSTTINIRGESYRGLPTTMPYDRDGALRQKVIGFEYTDTFEANLKPLL